MYGKGNFLVVALEYQLDTLWKVLSLNGLFFVFSCLTSSFITMKMKSDHFLFCLP
ncbi:hypothetical protein XSR1_220046 [Xenorhabdus szentirmaii DSM 16338]|uniref:Uncharacterized protein n=1 Tax=Xenorhabdus szentirmaii DSM 16338 TaxID=1427518 RepID=W1IYG0_9GAMM|nr:hypothetical protein XSR1_220046 [Xenorhabdus szentirmaii DSM 16338]